ncbi:MAG: hypothetical protein ACRC2T_04830, partial [Thermoguttaceae bacterium]
VLESSKNRTMKKTGKSKFGVKTRQLKFETMEERLALSVSPLWGSIAAENTFLAPLQEMGTFVPADTTGCVQSGSDTFGENTQCVKQQASKVNVKTIQEGAVSPNGQIQQSIIFEFERTIDVDRLDDLSQPLTIEYEMWCSQSIKTDYYDKIADQVEKPISITFQPGETKVQVEFSGFGYNEYKSRTSLGVAILGITGYDPEVISEKPYAHSLISLVDNPGEQSIPKVSVKVLPELTYNEKIVFEFERTVDPNNPHAIDEPLEISYMDNFGWYSTFGGFRGKGMTLEGRFSKTLVFQPGQTKIVLEFAKLAPDRWMSISVGLPIGNKPNRYFELDANGYLLPPQINTLPDYIVEQGLAEVDFEHPCSCDGTAPVINVMPIQDIITDSNGEIVQNGVLEFERVLDPSNPEAVDEPLTFNFKIESFFNFVTYGRDELLGNFSIQFRPGETKVRFELDAAVLQNLNLVGAQEMVCVLETPGVGAGFDSPHYHVLTRFAKLNIFEAKTPDGVDQVDINETPTIIETAPDYTDSDPAEDEQVEIETFEVSTEPTSNSPIINREDNSEEAEIIDVDSSNNLIRVSHNLQNTGPYTALFADKSAEKMWSRQMLDLDQSRELGQGRQTVFISELIWSDDELFDKERFEFATPLEETETQFMKEFFEDQLLPLVLC